MSARPKQGNVLVFRLLIAWAAMVVYLRLLTLVERCRRWPRVGLAVLSLCNHVSRIAQRMLSDKA
jgi:hypothetical protein